MRCGAFRDSIFATMAGVPDKLELRVPASGNMYSDVPDSNQRDCKHGQLQRKVRRDQHPTDCTADRDACHDDELGALREAAVVVPVTHVMPQPSIGQQPAMEAFRSSCICPRCTDQEDGGGKARNEDPDDSGN